MHGSVQRIVDRVAGDVGRPALLEDQFERVLAYSTHNDPLDAVRSRTILHRQADPEVVAWLNMRGIRSARSPIRVPGNSDLGMLPRLCFPIRHHGELLGYLWFVEAADRMSAQDMARAGHAASELAALLYRDMSVQHSTSERAAHALRCVLQGGTERLVAARELHDDGYVDPNDALVAIVLQPARDPRRVDPEPLLCRALGRVARAVHRHGTLQLRQPDHGVVVLPLAPADPEPLEARVCAVGEVLHAGGCTQVAVGVGSPRAGLADLADSYREARLAARTGAMLGLSGEIAYWDRLGAYQVVAELADEPGRRVIHPGLRALIGDAEATTLLETLEIYLDVACNAQLAAELLHLHRGSLYYRLQRLEQLAGTSLRDGLERLSLHLELKLARLTGEYAPRQPVARPAAAS